MKAITLALLSAALTSPAQDLLTAKALDIGPDFRVWETIERLESNEGVQWVTSRVEQVEVGMNFLTEDGKWATSSPRLEVARDGASAFAKNLQFQVSFAPNPLADHVFDITLPGKERLAGRFFGLGYVDQDGTSILIAEPKEVTGEIRGAEGNEVVFPSVLGEQVDADLIYRVDRGGLSQNLLLKSKILPPTAYKLSEGAVLTLFTEFVAHPEFGRVPHPIPSNDAVRKEDSDDELDLRSMHFKAGRAFTVGQETTAFSVFKNLESLEGRTFLLEKVSWSDAAAHVELLPAPKGGQALVQPPRSRTLQAALVKRPAGGQARFNKPKREGVALLSGLSEKGFLVDYELALTTASKTWKSDTVYWIAGAGISVNTNVFEPGCVIKMTNGAKLTITGPSTWPLAGAPVVMTSIGDLTHGEKIGTNAAPGGYHANPALEINYTQGSNVIRNLRILNATRGIVLAAGSTNTIRHVQMVNVGTGIDAASGVNYRLQNALFHNVKTNLAGSGSTANIEHLTVDTTDWLAYNNLVTVKLTNALLIAVANGTNTMTGVSITRNATTNSVFSAVGAGWHYPSASYRVNGTSGIDAGLASELLQMTVYPPTLISSNFTTSTLLGKSLPANQNWQGYHYPAIDYAISGLTITNSSLVVTQGVSFGMYGTRGFTLESGGKFLARGNPTNPVRLAYYNTVQEQPIFWGLSNSFDFFKVGTSPATVPEINIRFGEANVLANQSGKRSLIYDNPIKLILRDSIFRSVVANSSGSLSPTVFALTNNWWQRGALQVYQHYFGTFYPVTLHLRNNTFLGSSVDLNYGTSWNGTWGIYDNFFCEANLTLTESDGFNYPTPNSNNGYKTTTPLAHHTGTVTVTSDDWQLGPYGRVYYPPLTNGSNLATLIDKGSTNAGTVSLFHHTTLNDTSREGHSTVDIGYHPVAVRVADTQLPYDDDYDGIINIDEDTNGSGWHDSGETSWLDPFIILPSRAPVFSPLAAPLRVDSSGFVYDDEPIYPLGSLTVDIGYGLKTNEDRLYLINDGTGAGLIGVSGNVVSYGGTAFGTFTTNALSNQISINFYNSSTPTISAVNALIRAIAYTNTSVIPWFMPRVVRFVLSDGGGKVTMPAHKTIEMGCAPALDVLFLIDRSALSGSLGLSNEKAAAQTLANYLDLSFGKDVGMVMSFCQTATNHPAPPNGWISNKTDLVTSINSITSQAAPCTDAAIHTALLDAQAFLDGNRRTNVAIPMIVLLSDGQSDLTQATNAAAQVKAKGTRIFSVQLGGALGILMREVASCSADAFSGGNQTQLDQAMQNIATDRCLELNRFPVVSVGGPSSITLPSTAALTGSATENGVAVPVTYKGDWTVVSGPGAVRFQATGTAYNTTATFSKPGSYTLRLRVSDSVFSGWSDLSITVSRTQTPPTVLTLTNQTVDIGQSLYLPGVVIDDSLNASGLPMVQTLAIQWTQQSGPSTVVFDSATSADTGAIVTGLPGVNVLRLSATDGLNQTSYAEMTLTVRAPSSVKIFSAVNYTNVALGGFRSPAPEGSPILALRGVSGSVRKAYLYWHGPTDLDDATANQAVLLNGRRVIGKHLGFGYDNFWNYSIGHTYRNSQAYEADVTSIVATFGDYDYTLENFKKSEEVLANGVSLVVLFDNPSNTNKNDVILQAGNDSNVAIEVGVDGPVLATAVDSKGNIYLGGAFSRVAGQARAGLAKLNGAGALDLTYAPTVNGEVRSMVIDPITTNLFIGGTFTSVNSTTRQRLARLSQTGLLLDTFNFTNGMDGPVNTLGLMGNQIVAGGNFSNVCGTTSRGLARLNTNGTIDTTFAVGVGIGSNPTNEVFSLAVSNSLVYAGGYISSYKGVSVGNLICVDGSGNRITTFSPTLNGAVRTLLVDGTLTYVGGSFTSVNGFSQTGLVRLTTTGIKDGAFNIGGGPAGSNATIHSIVKVAGPKFMVSGSFTNFNGVVRDGLVRLQLTGAVDSGFFNFSTPPYGFDGPIYSLTLLTNDWVAVGGNFLAYQTNAVSGFATVASSGVVSRIGSPTAEGWFSSIANLAAVGAGTNAVLELHVSDGQRAEYSDLWQLYLDPDLYLNGSLLATGVTLTNCQSKLDTQIFDGQSVTSLDNCRNRSLWDVKRWGITPWLANPTSLSLVGQGGNDAVSLVLMAAILPTNTAPASTGTIKRPDYYPPIARADTFALDTSSGGVVLDVLANDESADGTLLTIVDVDLSANGTTAVLYNGSAIGYSPKPGFNGNDTFSYTIEDLRGIRKTATITVTVSGTSSPYIACGDKASGTLIASDNRSVNRGNTFYADRWRFTAGYGNEPTIKINNSSAVTHLYVRNLWGELIASGYSLGGPSELSFTPTAGRGDYLIEITTDLPLSTASYEVELADCAAGGSALEVTIGGTVVPKGMDFDLGEISPGEQVSISVRNLSTTTLHGVRLGAAAPSSGIQMLVNPEVCPSLPGGETWSVGVSFNGHSGLFSTGLKIDAEGSIDSLYTCHLDGTSGGTDDPIPTITVSSPIPGAVYAARTNILFSATTDVNNQGKYILLKSPDGRQRLLSASTTSFSTIWTQAVSGSYQAIFRSRNGGAQAEVAIPFVVDFPKPNVPPTAVNDSFFVAAGSQTNFIQVLTNDFDAGGESFRLVSYEQGQLGDVNQVTNSLTYKPVPGIYGDDWFQYVIADARGLRATGTVSVSIIPLTASISSPANEATTTLGNPFTLQVNASTSRGAIVRVDWFTNNIYWGASVKAPSFTRSWMPPAAGFYSIKAVAYSDNGLRVETSTISVGVNTGTDKAPIAIIQNVQEGSWIQDAFLEVRGTASDPNGSIDRYYLRFRRFSDDAVLASLTNTVGVVNGVLGNLDLSAFDNGVYDLELEVQQAGGTSRTRVRCFYESDAKIGHISFSENDLTVPTGGLPLTAVRTYNSARTNAGSFGPGWTLSLFDVGVEIDEYRAIVPLSYDTGSPTGNMRQGGGRDVTLTLPDGRRTTFQFNLEPVLDPMGVPTFAYKATWSARPGVFDQLRPMGLATLRYLPWQTVIAPFWSEAGPETPLDNFEFPGFVLTTTDGTRFNLVASQKDSFVLEPTGSYYQDAIGRERPKLSSIVTRAGEQIVFSNASTGFEARYYNVTNVLTRTVKFDTNGFGQISAIWDPLASSSVTNPPVLKYDYDSSRRLIRVHRLLDNVGSYAITTYFYAEANRPFYLTSVLGPDGVEVARNVYDTSGKLAEVWDAGGQVTRFQHDLVNRRETIVDPLNHQTIHEYDGRGNVVRTISASGQQTHRRYDGARNLVEEKDGLWNTSSFTYDNAGNRLTSRDGLGNTVTNTYSSQNELLVSRDPRGYGSTNFYDVQGLLTRVTDALGQSTSFLYDTNGRLVCQIDAANTKITNRYDLTGNITTAMTLSASGTVLSSNSYTYDINGLKTREISLRTLVGTTRETLTNSFVYDRQGRLIFSTNALGGVRKSVYDVRGKLTSSFDELGRETLMLYDRRGNLIQTIYPQNSSGDYALSRTVYDALNRPLYVQDRVFAPFGNPDLTTTNSGTCNIYDPAGRIMRTERLMDIRIALSVPDSQGYQETIFEGAGPISETEDHLAWFNGALISARSTEFDDVGRVKSITDSWGPVTRYGYDAAGRRILTTDALGNSTRSGFDANGNQVWTKDALGRQTDFLYDPLNRLVVTTYPIALLSGTATTSQVSYDNLGRKVAETNQNQFVTRFGYDELGRLTQVTNAISNVTKYAYDELGNLKEVEDARNNKTKFEYDKLGRRTKRTLPGNQSETFGYDSVGNLLYHTNLNGQVISYQYDSLNQRVSKSYAGSSVASWAYDGSGRRTNMVDLSGQTAYVYNKSNHLARKLVSIKIGDTSSVFTNELAYGHDGAGRLRSINSASAGGLRQTNSYDLLGRLTEVGFVLPLSDPATLNPVSYRYDAVGNLTGVTNFLLYSPEGDSDLVRSYQYDALNRLTNAVVNQSGTNLASFFYRVDRAGRRTNSIESVLGTGATFDWQYDLVSRLTRESINQGTSNGVAYGFDVVGNRNARTASASYSVLTNQTLSYDANDRIATVETYSSSGALTQSSGLVLSYDPEDRLTNLVQTGVSTSAILYNGDGQRVRKTTGNQLTYYLVDDQNLTGYEQVIERFTATGNNPPDVSAGLFNVWGSSLVAAGNISGDLEYPITDGHGNVRSTIHVGVDNTGTTGNALYDAYGVVLNGGIASTVVFARHAGEELDPDLNMVYLRARWYRPSHGRFATMDTFEGNQSDPLSLHKYLYASANPINMVDPSGHESLLNITATMGIITTLANITTTSLANHSIGKHFGERGATPDALFFNVGGGGSARGLTAGANTMFYYDFKQRSLFLLAGFEAGVAPISVFKKQGGWGYLLSAGFAFNTQGPGDFSGWGFTATWPAVMAKSVIPTKLSRWYYFLTAMSARNSVGTQLSKSSGVLQYGYSTSGAAYVGHGAHFNSFAATVGYTADPILLGEIPGEFSQMIQDATRERDTPATVP